MLLETEVSGIKLKNPLVLASGILGNNPSLLKRVEKAGAGAVTTKTVLPKPTRGFSNPVVVELPFGIVNAMGLPNPGIDEFEKELREARGEINIPIIGSAGGSTPEEVAYVAGRLQDAGVDAVEVNASCPHVRGHGVEVGSTPEMMRELVMEVRKSVKVPLIVKLSPMFPDVRSLGRSAVDAGANALNAVNTFRAMYIDVEAMRPVLSNKFGGLSGPAIKPIAVRCVYELADLCDVIGTGGVETWRDAAEMVLAGAKAVGIGTAVRRRGLGVFSEINSGLESYLLRKGLSLRELVGRARID
ncbi:MAG: dihydroorotate dehydrogenase [Candidatus Korarchaeum sp.]|nr:dihydroorotate dehydrogenase [Candidatus Korarchaeum sp.]MDW8035556.1 dihydroorotate dehydrogenase [Candidatus Korarchaeum sp.]